MNHEEQRYLDILNTALIGEDRDDRTGVGTYSIFDQSLEFSLLDDQFPLLTTKKMFLKGIVEELLFFLRGDTDTKLLEAKGVNIWKGNTTREFLDKRGLTYLAEGDMGKGYGFQWRNFGGERIEQFDLGNDLKDYDKTNTYLHKGTDQISSLLYSLKNDPNSRRHILSAWNPDQLNEMALPPCHMFAQFIVHNKEYLSCRFTMRSVDSFLGLPYNIASYALLTKIMAKAVGLKPSKLVFNGGDVHVYKNHLEAVQTQIERTPYEFPKLKINKELNSIKDIECLQYGDFELIGYDCHHAIKAKMAV